MGQRHHLRAAASRVFVPRGGDGLVQPLRAEWRLSNTLTGDFCMEALEKLTQTKPEIFNSDQGSQYTAEAFTSRLEAAGVAISMDGRGRAIDNVFVERLWRSVKYEDVYLKDYVDGWQADASLAAYFRFYNNERIHQGLGYRTPWEIYRERGSSDGPPSDKNELKSEQFDSWLVHQKVKPLQRPNKTCQGSCGPPAPLPYSTLFGIQPMGSTSLINASPQT